MIFDDQSLGLKEMEGVTTSRFGEVATKLRGGVYIIYGLHIGIIQGLCKDCIYAPRSQIWFIFTPKFGGRFPF